MFSLRCITNNAFLRNKLYVLKGTRLLSQFVLHKWSRLTTFEIFVTKIIHPTLYNGHNYSSILRRRLIHVSKKGQLQPILLATMQQFHPKFYIMAAVTVCAVQWSQYRTTGISILQCGHYGDVIIGTMASQITSLTIVCADQRKHQSSASLAFVPGIHRGPVNFPHKWPLKWKMFPFDDAIMVKYCSESQCTYLGVDMCANNNIRQISSLGFITTAHERQTMLLIN